MIGRWMVIARPIPSGLAGMLALIVAVEGCVAWRSLGLTPRLGLAVRFAAGQADAGAPGRGVLALGDSVIKFGFDPEVVESHLGKPAYNLAVPGMPPQMAYLLFRRVLAAGSRPAAVVIGQMAWGGDFRDKTHLVAEMIRAGEGLRIAWFQRDAGLVGRLLLARSLPSVRYRPTLREAALRLLDPGAPRGRRANPGSGAARVSLRHWAARRGGVLRDGQGPLGRDPELGKQHLSERWPLDPVAADYLRRIAELAADHDIPVVWVIPPFAPWVLARRDALGHDAETTRELRVLLARLPRNVAVLDARRSGFPESEFFDPIHLNARGARHLSAALAEALKLRLTPGPEAASDSPRWVALPRLEAGPARVAGRPSDAVR